jgi:hypothetical protein
MLPSSPSVFWITATVILELVCGASGRYTVCELCFQVERPRQAANPSDLNAETLHPGCKWLSQQTTSKLVLTGHLKNLNELMSGQNGDGMISSA